MKAEILKIAGVKSEKEFYKKYPSEEAFMKVHGKEFKKAKLSNAMPEAQDGWVERAANAEFSCRAHPRSELRESYTERSNPSSQMDKEDLKQLKKEYNTSPYKDSVNINEYFIAKQMAENRNRKMTREDQAYSKFFDPNTGAMLPSAGSTLRGEGDLVFANRMFPGTNVLTPGDILQGIKKDYNITTPMKKKEMKETMEKADKIGYQKPKAKKGRQVNKFEQLTDFGNPPIAQDGMDIGSYTGGETFQNSPILNFDNYYQQALSSATGISKEEREKQQAQQSQSSDGGGGGMDIGSLIGMAGSILGGKRNGGPIHKAQLGLNAAPGGSMPTPNLNTQNMLWGTSGSITQAPTLGGTVPSQIQGMNMPAASAGGGGMNILGKLGGVQGIAGSVGGIIQGIQGLQNEKKQLQEAETAQKVSELTLRAAESRPEQIKRRYVRPEDQMVQPNQLSPSYGVGTNILAARDGMQIGGNLTEIQNMYNPGDLYSDLGYEPLSDSDIVKQYRAGGFIPKGQFGAIAGQLGGVSNQLIGGIMGGNNAGGNLGSTIGSTAGSLFGPVGGLVGGAVGQIAGNLLDKKAGKIKAAQEATKKNVEKAAFTSGMQSLQAQNSAFVRNGGKISSYEEGGWVSHDWQPQVITQFGEYPIKSLLTKDPMMDTLRTGGNITQNNMFSTDQYALGGELKTTWGGYAEPISHNPYMPGTGETVMFRGKSHEESDGKGHTGIGVKYGDGGMTDYAEFGSRDADADVEVERGEPATEMIDPQTGDKNMVVFGNLKISPQSAIHIGDPAAKNKKFKTYVDFLGKVENNQNKKIEKASEELDSFDDYSPTGLLRLNSLHATDIGGNMNLKDIAVKKSNAAAVQNAINDTAVEHGILADDLAIGKIKKDKEAMKQQAKYGKEIFKAQTGWELNPLNPLAPKIKQLPEVVVQSKAAKKPAVETKTPSGSGKKKVTVRTTKGKTKAKITPSIQTPDDNVEIPLVDIGGWDSEGPVTSTAKSADATTTKTTGKSVEAGKRNQWIDALNELLPYFRPSDQEGFDTSQLYPEMAAIAMNQLEPVQAQLYHPDLGTPYDISLQDQLNANQADFNALQKQMGYNPAALATLAGQKYAANKGVLGEQFRLNQAEKQRVYEGNRALLNDAQLKNLGILDTQMTRQETAKSKTKEQALEALKSMSDKIAKNKLENRTLGIYENLYNYRFGKSGRAQNWNPLAQFNIERGGSGGSSKGGLASGLEFTYDANGNIVGTRKSKEDSDVPSLATQPIAGKNGLKTKKNTKNGNIVRAIKNL